MEQTFTQKVYAVVRKIPSGKVLTYKEVARRAGNPRAARAVGTALSKNYNAAIPCHRVIKSNGQLGSYNRGALQKKKLLEREGFGYNKTMKKGFTLIELLVVVSIVAILAAVIFVNASTARKKGRNAARAHDIESIAKAIDSYVVEHNGQLPPLPVNSSEARPGITSYDLDDSGPQDKGGWNAYIQSIGLNPVYDPLNLKPLQGVPSSTSLFALFAYSYIVAYKGITYDEDGDPATTDWKVFPGTYDVPMVYARIEGNPTACTGPDTPAGCTPVCDGGVDSAPVIIAGVPVTPPVGSGYGSSNCRDLSKGCIPPASTFGTNPWICIPIGYNK